MILDEEQRFGVKHKEKLKKLRHNVDVLALTATPIPRTLHMSMMGVRDISIISTPPEHRQPIITYISEFDDYHRHRSHSKGTGSKGPDLFRPQQYSHHWPWPIILKKLVPEVRLDVAHGRMTEDELEKVMLQVHRTRKSTCWSAPPSSNPVWISPPPTRFWSTGPTGSVCPRFTSCGAGWADPTSRPMPICLFPGQRSDPGCPKAAESPHGTQRSGIRFSDRHERSENQGRRHDSGRLPVRPYCRRGI